MKTELKVSFYKRRSDQEKTKDVDLLDFLLTDHYKDIIEQIRKGDTALKDNLGAITPHAMFESRRRADEPFTPSGVIFVDVDGKENKHHPLHIKSVFASIKQTYAVRLSSSGEGVHAFINIGDNDLEKCYLSLKMILEDVDIKIDKCKDYARLCYASYDEDIYINRDATVFKPYSDEVLFPKHEPAKPIGNDEFNFKDYCSYFAHDYREGNRDNWIFHKAYEASVKGVAKEIATAVLLQYAEKGMSSQTILNKIERAYK